MNILGVKQSRWPDIGQRGCCSRTGHRQECPCFKLAQAFSFPQTKSPLSSSLWGRPPLPVAMQGWSLPGVAINPRHSSPRLPQDQETQPQLMWEPHPPPTPSFRRQLPQQSLALRSGDRVPAQRERLQKARHDEQLLPSWPSLPVCLPEPKRFWNTSSSLHSAPASWNKCPDGSQCPSLSPTQSHSTVSRRPVSNTAVPSAL